MRRIASQNPEIAFTAIMLVAMSCISSIFGLRITLPSGLAAMLFWTQVALPLLAIVLWAIREARIGRRPAPLRPMLAVVCYAVVILVHFNMKLWVPFVRPVTYDMAFWRIDQFAYPVVSLCRTIDAGLARIIRPDSGFYVGSLPIMFYISLAYHARTAPDIARKLFLSALILQGLGALSYYLFPALGPFLFENGSNPALTEAQHNMLVAHRAAIATGPGWLVDHGESVLFAGLGAMPSLHAASSYMFVWFAWRHGRILLPTYLPLFAYILVVAVAARWHYLVDIPVGIALARLSIHLAFRLDDRAAAVRHADVVAAGVPVRLAPAGRRVEIRAGPTDAVPAGTGATPAFPFPPGILRPAGPHGEARVSIEAGAMEKA